MASCLPLPFPDHCSPPDSHRKDGEALSFVSYFAFVHIHVDDPSSAFHTVTEVEWTTTSMAGGCAGASERELVGTYQWGTTILEPNTASGVTLYTTVTTKLF
ncbi:hypothetical protein Pmani_019530 [Petrolisthes manimaculis]|uniref:Uncharacterized protein n=1 Tax=Petrolisthes manimaculis TaxID=1843537 RepID=A0AAE1U7B0_9EUCA|nr:hypothetical protein Pmani_019530 [Petrolisthes manimaculis]